MVDLRFPDVDARPLGLLEWSRETIKGIWPLLVLGALHPSWVDPLRRESPSSDVSTGGLGARCSVVIRLLAVQAEVFRSRYAVGVANEKVQAREGPFYNRVRRK